MPVKATEIEARIAKAWGRCGVTARGMWLTIRSVIESEPENERALFMEHAMPLDIEQAALMGRCEIATASRAIYKLVKVGLLAINPKGEYFSPWMHSLFVARKGGAKRVAKFRQKQGSGANGALRNDPLGRYISQCNTDVTQPPPSPPPKVSLSHSLSLPNPPTPSPGASENAREIQKKPPSPDETIYEIYPRHVGKGAAMSAIFKARRALAQRGELDPTAFLLERVQLYANARHAIEADDPGERQFTPHPASWFNQGRYDDDPTEWTKRKTLPPKRNGNGTANPPPTSQSLRPARAFGKAPTG